MPNPKDFQATFKRLKGVLQKYDRRLTVTTDKPGIYYLDAAYSEKYKKVVFFGAVMIKKNYVSYHLFPVYAFPELLKEISPTLKKQMQGKACFNFTTIDDAMLKEIAALTKQGFERFKQEGFV